MVEKYLNEMRGPRDGGDTSPAASLAISPAASAAASPAAWVESSVAGATRNAKNDGVDE